MFTDSTNKHPHWISAYQRFAANQNVAEIAELAGMNPQTLRNKLNPRSAPRTDSGRADCHHPGE